MLREPFITASLSHGLWQFPPNLRQQRAPKANSLAEIQERRHRIRDAGRRRSNALVDQLQREGASLQDLFEQQAWGALEARLRTQSNRCSKCWHDREQQCICSKVAAGVQLSLPVRVLVLMHHKEVRLSQRACASRSITLITLFRNSAPRLAVLSCL